MSGVDFWGKLLGGVDVEWKPLGDVGTFIRGKRFVKADLRSEGVPCIHYGEMYTHFGISARKTKSFLDAELASRLRCANRGDVVIVGAGETVEDIGNGTAWLGDDDVVIHDACFAYKSNLNPAYSSYFLRTKNFKEQIKRHISSGKISSINSSGLSKAVIPIPCPDNPKKSLEIQAEIVRILDAFTELTAELTAELTTELTARKKQYNYYRDKLLRFEEGEVEWRTLGEVAKIQRGASPRPIAKYITDDEDGVPWIKIGDTSPGSKYVNSTGQKITIEGAEKSRVLNVGDFIISNSMSFGRPYILGIRGAIHDGWASISGFGETLRSDYLYHYLSSNTVQNYWAGKINSGSVSNLNADIIKTLPVPIPDLVIQDRIASILDKFDALTNTITEGLPREIALRQKQYEYYRTLLLGFPKPEEAAA